MLFPYYIFTQNEKQMNEKMKESEEKKNWLLWKHFPS